MSEQEPRDGAAERAPRERGRDASSNRGGRSASSSDGERKPYVKRDGDKPYAKRDGERKPYVKRDGDKPYAKRDGERKPYVKRDGDKPYVKRDGDKPYVKRDGERKPYVKRDGDKPYVKRDGERKPYVKRDGDKPYAKRDGERKPYVRRGGDKPYGSKPPRPTRGGADRPDRAMRDGETRSVRPRHDDPHIPDEVTARDLNPGARNELKTLSKENADQVARHLAMAAQLIDEDPELAHQHALSASRRAGRIAVVRETLAITAYATGDYGLALRELRTYRRISGKDDQIALLVDSERGVGRPDRALEAGRAVDRAELPTSVRVELAIAMSGARLDMGEPDRALSELDIPELDPDRAFEWSPALFAARATVLEELGRADEAERWHSRALVAAEALDAASGADDLETVFVEEVEEEPVDDAGSESHVDGAPADESPEGPIESSEEPGESPDEAHP
ncbi:primosomal protein [Microbacterium sp. HD4P20]|uniref:primosomal protein n=1 Tax=Microbacterium sp. HD4P20 TaxID=2864874 RepID=UPI0020A3DFB3|nr:primosomal protein [Microbacterium sp. HD4P20]MCP2637223.1 primosomal protein [Microbacterium sp. HD4P20]